MMSEKEWKKKQLDILELIKEKCEQNGIEMVLCGETALEGFRSGSLPDDLTVAIRASDAERFVSVIESGGDENITTESMLNNGAYPSFEIRVLDLSTTDFNANNCRQYLNNCIHVTVKLIESLSMRKIPFAVGRMRFRNYKKKIVMPAEKNDPAKSAKVFRTLARFGGGRSESVRIGNRTFGKYDLSEVKTVDIDGNAYRVPGNIKSVLRSEFGKGWRSYVCEKYIENERQFRSTALRWEDYRKVIADVDMDEYDALLKDYRKKDAEFKELQKTAESYYDILERTYDRFKMWEKYEPQKAELERLHSEGNTAELKKRLKGYMNMMDMYARKGLGLCFDPDIFEWTMEIVRADEGDEREQELRGLVPESHMQPIRIKDYTGKYIN